MKIHLFDRHYVKRRAPINLSKDDDGLFQNALPGFEIKSSHLLILKNVFIFIDVPYKSGVFYLPYAFLHPLEWIEIIKRIRMVFYFNTRIVSKAIWIIDTWSTGYFHWFTDALPRLIASSDYASAHKVLLPNQYQKLSFVTESLNLLGYQPEFYDPKKKIKVVDLVLPSHTADTGNYNEEILNTLRNKLLSKIPQRIPERKIYISRKKALFRFILNEDDVINKLVEFGFEVHCFEEYSLQQQMEIMAETKCLVSLHGAGLTNMIYMQKGGSVLELRNQNDSNNNCYFSLASAVDLNYYYILNKVTKERTQFADFVINIDNLGEVLKKMIKN